MVVLGQKTFWFLAQIATDFTKPENRWEFFGIFVTSECHISHENSSHHYTYCRNTQSPIRSISLPLGNQAFISEGLPDRLEIGTVFTPFGNLR